ncbi:MAG: MFS transporter [Myxococcales bacterium]
MQSTILQRLRSPFADLPRPIWALFVGNVVNYAGNFVWPLLTLLLTDRLGLSAAVAGVYVSLAVFAYMPGTALGGRLADRYGRKRVFVLSRAASALLLVPCALFEPSLTLVWLIIASRTLTAAADPALSAMAADLASGERRAKAISLLYLGLNLGFAVGPLLAGLLYRDHLPWIFLGNALATFGSALVVLFFVPETLGHDRGKEPDAERPIEGSLWSVARARPQLLPLGVALVLLSVTYVQSSFSLPLEARLLLGDEAGPRAYGVAMGVNGLAVVLATFLTARLTYPSLLQIAFGGALYAVGFGAVGLVQGVPGLIATTIVWSFGEVLVANHWRIYVSDQSPSSHRARLQGLMSLVVGAGFILGPLLAGSLIETFGLSSVWLGCLVAAGSGSALLAAYHMRRQRQAAARPVTPQTA